MLALSRRPGERILFPGLNISLQILQVKGNNVRVGIDAPAEVVIVREEISNASQPPAAAQAGSRRLSHAQRNQLNTAVLALHLAEKELQAGMVGSAEKTLEQGLKILESLDREVAEATPPAPTATQATDIAALLVEDDPVERSLLTSFLRLRGFRVETVHDGYEALQYLASHPRPDFVLLDMRLPRLNGRATLMAIRNDPHLAGLRVFAVTGSSQQEAGVPTGPTGVDRWFQKPLNPARLADAMSAAMAN